MCNACFRNDKIKSHTTFTVEYKDCIIVVKNVPCFECQICGEITFSDEVSEHLEELVNGAKSVLQEISVIDYSKAA
ncbi:MAG: type II toxin-antitoxin system MqsA family antitoxin [Oribacterium sp.]|nr:type II toxin-antitoxin system MqsA family antitoxin [Oribacterium sp.]